MKTITTYAQGMSEFLRKSELTERRAFIETFVKEIELLPDNAVVRYTVPVPDDSFIPGKKEHEIPLNGSAVSTSKSRPTNQVTSGSISYKMTALSLRRHQMNGRQAGI